MIWPKGFVDSMGKYDGKKLLMLGSNVCSDDICNYAKLHGAYVVAADWNPIEKSSAKRIADEALDISTADVDALCEYVERNQVDGVLAGISEFNLKSAMAVAERCGLPFYCTGDQWDSIERKDKFRHLCIDHGVPYPKTYYSGDADGLTWDTIEYPVVLKPVDACTSAGVHFCSDRLDVEKWLGDAVGHSSAGKIILEQFVTGDEFTAHYVICGGKAELSCIDNRYPVAVHDGDVTTVPVARLYPCLYLDEYLDHVDPQMRDLCESLGVKDGVLFVQGLYDSSLKRFAIFEAGLRSAGEAPCRFLRRITGNDYMSILVDVALGVEPSFDFSRNDPYLNGHCCGVVSFVGRGGEVCAVTGLPGAVEGLDDVVVYESRYPAGTTIPDGDTLRQLAVRFVLDCPSREAMSDTVSRLNESIDVLGANGESLVIKMDPKRVFEVR